MKQIIKSTATVALVAITAVFVAYSQRTNTIENYPIKTPQDFLKIIEESKVLYNIVFDTSYSRYNYDLNTLEYNPNGINPFVNIKKNNEGNYELVEDFPTDPHIIELFKKSEEAFKNRNYDSAQIYLKELTNKAPDWFKGWTNYADCFYLKEEYDSAIVYFKKALSLNPLGYQEYNFLSDCYYNQNKMSLALETIINAMVLNKNSLHVRYAFDRVLKANNKKLDPDRLILPFYIKYISPQESSIYYTSKDTNSINNVAYFAMANVMAAWAMENEIKNYFGKDTLSAIYMKNYEAIINGITVMVDSNLTKKEGLDKTNNRLADIFLDGYLKHMIYWEIIFNYYPYYVFALSDNDRYKMSQYILKYCLIDSN